jgi:hypothetical protein
MAVTMVDVRKVRVGMHERFVRVLVCVCLTRYHVGAVRMLVVRIVYMAMRMRERFMRVRVFVPLGQVKPEPERHESGRSIEQR